MRLAERQAGTWRCGPLGDWIGAYPLDIRCAFRSDSPFWPRGGNRQTGVALGSPEKQSHQGPAARPSCAQKQTARRLTESTNNRRGRRRADAVVSVVSAITSRHRNQREHREHTMRSGRVRRRGGGGAHVRICTRHAPSAAVNVGCRWGTGATASVPIVQ